MKIGSLFSGYGGLDLGVQAVLGGDVAWHVEYDKAPSRILDHHWPDVPNYGDVTALDFTTVEPVDILTGGYPCQPFSHAGKRKGTDDDRHLWPHVLRAIRELGPRLVILENVRGHLTLGFDTVLADLADLGWSAEWGLVRASDAGAPHQRARLFIVAYPADTKSWWRGLRSWARQSGRHQSLCGRDAANNIPTNASSQRHGAGQDARGLGRLDSQNAGGPRQRQRARQVTRDRGATDAADPKRSGRQRRAPQQSGASEHIAGHGADAANTDLSSGQAWGVEPHREGRQPPSGRGQSVGRDPEIGWGAYRSAIARWEHVTGRSAPAPTEPGRTGQPRLSPAFVEWMMGLPAGHVTDPAIGISRNDQLKALGNGVVPQQAALALSLLLPRIGEVAA